MVEYADDDVHCENPIIDDVLDEVERDYSCVKSDGIKVVRAERSGRNVLILFRLKDAVQRLDGKRAVYELTHRWLTGALDNDIHCVQGSESTYWQRKELDLKKPLFKQFQLF